MARKFRKNARKPSPKLGLSVLTEGYNIPRTTDKKTEGTILIFVTRTGQELDS
jgi:hypothetical protein